MKNNKILVFEINARQAHFKQPASNSTSLTFSVPPRTTIIGLLGAITGYDNYYDVFSTDNCDIAIEINSLNKTYFEDLNYIGEKYKVKNIPVEYIYEEKGNKLSYLVYISHIDNLILEELEDRINNNRYHHGMPKLGKTECFATLNVVDTITEIEEKKENEVIISTAIKAKDIKSFDMLRDYEDNRIIESIYMPRELNKDRYLKSSEQYIVPKNKKGIFVKEIDTPFLSFKLENNIKNIAWM